MSELVESIRKVLNLVILEPNLASLEPNLASLEPNLASLGPVWAQ